MADSKGLLKSGTFWGGLTAAVPLVVKVSSQVLGFVGIDVPQELLETTITDYVAAFGGTVAIWRRVVAKKAISGLL